MSEHGIRVVIADDQTLITQSFKVLLETKAQDLEVVGLAHDGREALALVEQLRPDVVLMDVRMPVLDGVAATREILRIAPQVKIIMLTTFDDDAYLNDAISAGAVGYLLKDISTDELINSIRAASSGVVLVSPTVARRLFRSPPGSDTGPSDDAALGILASLSCREIEILKLLALGLENKQIADRLRAAEQTIKNNVSVIYSKLGVGSRKDARGFAMRSRLIRPDTTLREAP